jgi:glycosyltransferase involved in cell wall biosynthesis
VNKWASDGRCARINELCRTTKDVGSIADGLEQLLNQPAARSELIAAGRERARTFFWIAGAETESHVFEQVARI